MESRGADNEYEVNVCLTSVASLCRVLLRCCVLANDIVRSQVAYTLFGRS